MESGSGLGSAAEEEERNTPPAQDDVYSSESDIILLTRALKNERNCPDILHFRTALIARVQRALLQQDLQCEEMCNEGERDLARFMMSIEVRRVRFLIKAYYRTRLHKIGMYNVAILDNPKYIACLSEAELKYCKDVFNAEGRHLKGIVDLLPGDFRSFIQESALSTSDRDMVPLPRLDTHVFCKLIAEGGEVAIDGDGEQILPMHEGELYFINYEHIQELVVSNKAVLV